MNLPELNCQIKALLYKSEESRPKIARQAARVSVYAVATGERLGMDDDNLLRLRVTAQLQYVVVEDQALLRLISDDPLSVEIIRLCTEFDIRRFGSEEQVQLSDAECEEWLQAGARLLFREEAIAALLAVQSLIQPIGT